MFVHQRPCRQSTDRRVQDKIVAEAKYLKEPAVWVQVFRSDPPCRGMSSAVLPYMDKRVFRMMCSPRIDVVARILNEFTFGLTQDHTGEVSSAYRLLPVKVNVREKEASCPRPKLEKVKRVYVFDTDAKRLKLLQQVLEKERLEARKVKSVDRVARWPREKGEP